MAGHAWKYYNWQQNIKGRKRMQWNDYPLDELQQYTPALTAEADFDQHW
jgi:hypothetical protein